MGGRPADGRLRPDLDLRRGDADADPRQGQGAEPDVGLLVRADRATSSPTTSSPRTCPRRSPNGRCGCGGWRCTRSSASSAATSPARAGRNTRQSGAVCGIELPAGLLESDKLPEPIFTPATKAEIGDHDENVDFDRAAEIVGDRALMEELRRISIEVYTARRRARGRARDHPRRHQVRVRPPRRRRDRPRRRGADPGLLALLARRPLRAGQRPSPPSTSSTSATGPTRRAGTTSRRRRSCRPTWSSRPAAKYVEAYERITETLLLVARRPGC